MKFSITISKFVLASFILMPFLSYAEASSLVSKEQMVQLFDVCRTDWSLYLRRLTELNTVLGRSLKTMSDRDYDKIALARDPGLLFAQVTWPELLERDGFAGFFETCATAHANVRSAFNSKNTALKKKALDDFNACLEVDYGDIKKAEPFRSMLTCYGQHARD